MRIACGFDHAGVPLRELVLATLGEAGHEPIDLGVEDDYPDIAAAVADAIAAGRAERGVLVCGSGAGVAIAVSKINGMRGATVHDHYTARQCVEHDDVNVACIGARVVGPELAADVLLAFAGAEFSGAERHRRRLAKIAALEAARSPEALALTEPSQGGQ
jgi:ribose 5-phosphate isomerase B